MPRSLRIAANERSITVFCRRIGVLAPRSRAWKPRCADFGSFDPDVGQDVLVQHGDIEIDVVADQRTPTDKMKKTWAAPS